MFWGVVIALLIVLLILFALKRKSSSKRNVILVGPSESGKTAIFIKLVHGIKNKTFTSLTCNSSKYVTEKTGKTVEVVDIPGHERIRKGFIEKYKRSSPAVAFVIDANTFESKIRDAGEFLFFLLGDPVLGKNPIVIVCNKQDEPDSKSPSVMRKRLEEEIKFLHEIHSKSLDDTANSSSTSLKFSGKDFSFSNSKVNVEFVETSIMDDNGLTELKGWLDKIAN